MSLRDFKVDNNTLTILRHWQAVQNCLILANDLRTTGIIFLTSYQSANKLHLCLIQIAKYVVLPRIKVHGCHHTYATLVFIKVKCLYRGLCGTLIHSPKVYIIGATNVDLKASILCLVPN